MLKKKVTPSLEDYLETIFFLRARNGDVRVTDVANEMSISKPSVNKAINVLKAQGLVSHEHYGLLNLTEPGEALAESVANRHIVIKRFLMNILGVEEGTADDEACKMEHSISTETVKKLSDHVDRLMRERERQDCGADEPRGR